MERPEITVRSARPDDAAGIGRVHVLAWQAGYRGLIPDGYLDGLDGAERGRRWATMLEQPPSDDLGMTLVAVADGEVAGIASYGSYRDPAGSADGDLCELRMINVDPDHWGTGVAQALMAEVVERLATERDESTAALWVLEGNGRGRRFYQKVGWTADGWSRTDDIGGTALVELRYTRPLHR